MNGWTDVLIEVVGTEKTNDVALFRATFGNPVIQEYGDLETIISVLKEIYEPMIVGKEL